MTKQEMINTIINVISEYIDDIADSDYKIVLTRENTALTICNRLINEIENKGDTE